MTGKDYIQHSTMFIYNTKNGKDMIYLAAVVSLDNRRVNIKSHIYIHLFLLIFRPGDSGDLDDWGVTGMRAWRMAASQ